MVRRIGGRAEQLDVVDERAVLARHAGLPEGRTDAEGELRQRAGAGRLEGRHIEAGAGDEEEPVAAPGHVAGDAAQPRHVDLDAREVTAALDVAHRDAAVLEELGPDRPDGSVDAVHAWLEPAHERERPHETDRPVPAHAQVAGRVEEDDPGRAVGPGGVAEESAHEDLRAAGLVDHRAAQVVELRRQPVPTLGEVSIAQVRTARHDEPRRLSARVGVDDVDGLHGRERVHDSRRARHPGDHDFVYKVT